MKQDIDYYNDSQSIENQKNCNLLRADINKYLTEASYKIYHGSPVWFIEDNPIVGDSKVKDCIRLLFWSGQTFGNVDLKSVGKYKAGDARYRDTDKIDRDRITIWLSNSIEIQGITKASESERVIFCS